MPKARGTFTVWYLPRGPRQSAAHDRWEHGITASNRLDLMRQAQKACPRGYVIKAITWQWSGTHTIWQRVEGRTRKQCWDNDVCQRAFGEQ